MTDNKLPMYVNVEQIQKVINAASGNRKHLVILTTLWETAMRADEIVNLRIENIIPPTSETGPVLQIKKSKGGNDRNIPLSTELYKLIIVFAEGRRTGFLFTNPKGKRLSTTAIRLIVYRYAEMSGVEVHIKGSDMKKRLVHPHTLRHSRAVYLLYHGYTIYNLQNFLGHKDLKTTCIYLKVLPIEMQVQYAEILREIEEKKRWNQDGYRN
jgi:integrase/recombinase XerD